MDGQLGCWLRDLPHDTLLIFFVGWDMSSTACSPRRIIRQTTNMEWWIGEPGVIYLRFQGETNTQRTDWSGSSSNSASAIIVVTKSESVLQPVSVAGSGRDRVTSRPYGLLSVADSSGWKIYLCEDWHRNETGWLKRLWNRIRRSRLRIT